LLAGWFQGVTPRTAGFNTLNIGAMNEATLLIVSVLMFIGAGPASTSGGIKVTTFAVLAYVL
jgi:trk system potassium uptake protein TrkH